MTLAIHWVQTALEAYAPPWIKWVKQPVLADVQLLHVVGKREVTRCAIVQIKSNEMPWYC
jgi:hypothetical protein